jgi:hypothetical protein
MNTHFQGIIIHRSAVRIREAPPKHPKAAPAPAGAAFVFWPAVVQRQNLPIST